MAHIMAELTKTIIEDPRSSKESRARRLESLRGLTRLSRGDFAKRCGVKPGSFQNWEGPRFGGLTEKAAKKIIRGAKTLGIYCTLEWLMHGIGLGPQIDERLYLGGSTHTALAVEQPKQTYVSSDEESRRIAEELLLFRQHYIDAVDFVVNDDGMYPRFKAGEYVAGQWCFNQEIESAVGQDCIVKLIDGEILLRNVKKGSTAERYTLICTNSNTSVDKPILYDMELIAAAPVIFMRRRDPRTKV